MCKQIVKKFIYKGIFSYPFMHSYRFWMSKLPDKNADNPIKTIILDTASISSES